METMLYFILATNKKSTCWQASLPTGVYFKCRTACGARGLMRVASATGGWLRQSCYAGPHTLCASIACNPRPLTPISAEPRCIVGMIAKGNHSHSIVATGFSEMSQRTRFTPGTFSMMSSRILQSMLKGISGTVAVTASTVFTARITTAHPI